MNTECSTDPLEFHALGRRIVVGRFDGGEISSDGGGLLLREETHTIGSATIIGGIMRYSFAVAILFFFSIPMTEAACTKHGYNRISLAEYYAETSGLAGTSLKAKLNRIIRDHRYYSYTPCVWEILKAADEDPDNPNNVIGIYTGRSIRKVDRVDRSNNPNDWNREHIWAKSHGFPDRFQHAHTDAHHIRAADQSVNEERGNNDFADGGWPDGECTQCREGNFTWEAPPGVKGDIARMMFYMAVRYEGNDDSGTPDLELVDRRTSSGEPFFGKLCTLLDWHFRDPVSRAERRRNNIVYSWQENRNPFIDVPEFVSAIWGGSCR